MPGPSYRSREWKKKHGGKRRPSVIRGDGTVTPLPRRSRGDYGRSGSFASVVRDRALVPNAVTGLSDRKQGEARKALRGSAEARSALEIAPELALKSAEIASVAIPGSGVARVGVTAARLLKAARVAEDAGDAVKSARLLKAAEKAAQDSQKASRAAKEAEAAGKGRKAGRLAEKAERRGVKARVKRERAAMTRGERLADRAKDAKTRTVARAQVGAHKVLAGTGSGGAAAYGVREATKKEGAKGAAKAVARGASRAPGRLSSRSVQAAATPALLPVTGVVPSEQKAQNIAQLPVQLGRATVEAPGATAKASIRSFRDMLLGSPAAVRAIVTDPAGALDSMRKDYEHRYGPLVQGDFEKFRKQVEEEGLTSFGLDALGAAGGSGAVIGRAAKAGKLGRRAEELMTAERPALKVAAGAEGKEQRVSKNVFGAAGQRGLDRYRRRRTEARSRGGHRGGDAAAREAVRGGDVEPVFPNAARAKAVAGEKARTRLQNMTQQGRVLNLTNRILGTMSRDQRRAVKWALTLGIRTADQAKRELPERIAQIRRERGIDSDYGKLDNIPEIEHVLEHADEIFTPDFGRGVDVLRRVEKRIAVGRVIGKVDSSDPLNPVIKEKGRRDPALDSEQALIRRESQQAEHLIGRRAEGESMADYRARYRAAKAESGLAEPGYFPSELSRRRKFSQSAVGGTRHSERPKAYGGELFRKGIENSDPAVMVRGLQRNVKRSNAWHMVSNIMERNSLPWSRTADGQGRSMKELIEHMGKEGIDESSVTFVNPGLMRKQMADDLVRGRGESGPGLGNPDFAELQDAIQAGSKAAGDFSEQRGWIAVPNKVMDELESSMRTRLGGRAADLAMSKMSGYLLAYNMGWLGFQTISTAAQAAIGGVTPADWILAQLYFKRLARENEATGARTGVLRRKAPDSSRQIEGNTDLDRLNSYVGVQSAHDMQQMPHLGANSPKGGMIGGAVEGYRIFREGKWGRGMKSANPIQAWFKLSQIPENANRKALAYKLLKSAEVKKMNKNLKRTDAAMNRIMSHFKLDPEGQIRAAIRDQKSLEDMAKGLADFLGDYQTFTAAERMGLKRIIPFYSWMRFATKFALFTMPAKHPVATSLVYQLGRLKSDELRDILGPGMDWALGKMWLGKPGRDTPYIDIYRGNPLLSSLTEFSSAKDLMSFVPPYIGILANQAFGRDYFTRQDLTVDGETQGRRFTEPGLRNSFQIALGQYLSTFTPYREFSEIMAKGTPMSSDSLPVNVPGVGGPEPKQYAPGSGSTTRAREQREYRAQGGAAGVLYRRNLPFLPQDSGPLFDTARYVNAETRREQARIRKGPGAGSSSDSSIDDAIDRALENDSSSRIDKAIDDALKRAGL